MLALMYGPAAFFVIPIACMMAWLAAGVAQGYLWLYTLMLMPLRARPWSGSDLFTMLIGESHLESTNDELSLDYVVVCTECGAICSTHEGMEGYWQECKDCGQTFKVEKMKRVLP